MKLKAIARLVKQAGVLEIWDDGKWIGTGEAMYASPLPGLDEDQIMTVLDLTKKEQENIEIRWGSEDERGWDLEDRPEEPELRWPMLILSIGGESWIPFRAPRSPAPAMLRADLLAPLRDSREQLRVCQRLNAAREPYLVVCAGWMVLAVFQPGSPSGLWDELHELSRPVGFDPATGEVDPYRPFGPLEVNCPGGARDGPLGDPPEGEAERKAIK